MPATIYIDLILIEELKDIVQPDLDKQKPAVSLSALPPGLSTALHSASPCLSTALHSASPGLSTALHSASPGLSTALHSASPCLSTALHSASPGLSTALHSASRPLSTRYTMSLASVLSAPLAGRGELLGRLFAESPLKELAAIYPVLLEEVFGFGGRPGWNLQLITRKCHPVEFERGGSVGGGGGAVSALSSGQWSLLSPQSAAGAGAPAWGGSLMLSPFELYLHHFCYFLLNPAQQAAPIAWTSPGDALYPTLLEDLMAHFLPCGGGWVPALPQPTAHRHLHQLHHPGLGLTPEPRRQVTTPPRLLLRSSLLRPASPGGAGGSPAAGGLSHGHGHLPETWRSETLLRTLAAFWLETGAPGGDQRPPSPGQDPRVASHDHVRVVRMLVKHMHFFANTPHQLPGLAEFKRQVQSMLQKKLYAFLRHTIQHWPTDTSFRLVLETWLSYIQPWRYTDYTNRNRSPSQSGQPRESDRAVDGSWARFVAENLLFYVTIFRQLLPRLQRMELTVPKYAYMVFRLAKVMCQPGLSDLIHSAEELRVGSRWPGAGRSAAAPAGGHSALLYAASVGQHIIDLEEPGFTYQSLMDASCTQQVHALVRRLLEARAELQARLAAVSPPPAESGSLWAGLLSALGGRTPHLTGAELSGDETRRAVVHLESAASLLATMYNLEVPEPGSVVTDCYHSMSVSPQLEVPEPGSVVTDCYHSMSVSPQLEVPEPGSVVTDCYHSMSVSPQLEVPEPGSVVTDCYHSMSVSPQLEVPEPGSVVSDSPATPAGQRLPGTPLPGRPAATPLMAGLLTPSALQSPAAARAAGPETELTPNGRCLTARGRRQLLSGLWRGDVTFQGDPERRPAQSWESAGLLRLLQTVAAHINKTYGAELAALYQRPDLAGYAARCVLLPPAVFYELERRPGGRSERLAVPRPAALTLRPLADQRCLAALAGAVLVALGAGLSPSTALVLVLLVLPVLLLLLAAALQMTRDWWRGSPPAELASPQR
ncbi:Sphingomyelin phosphodiesterase 4 [Amphibalanus amphitrite]|uniref:Sphingomyelin phosphodiesterase 4 n=1 Tax=Amphibalanus amphitrite TaxID=1232801 RepID=A0A6A4XBV9_AMPAM|nr:Sphingomyelin phosphodiesterase 4 [Amphibalanus amphitrite]